MSGNRKGILLSTIIITAVVLVLLLIFTFSGIQSLKDTTKIEIKDGLIYKTGAQVPFTGRILDTLENKIIEYDVIEGMKSGEFCLLSLTGEFAVHGFLKNNKNNGTWRYFYSNGNIESQGNFKDDKTHGTWIWYFENGNIRTIGYYINGNSEGTWRTFDESGRVVSVTNYKHGHIQSEVVVTKLSFS